MSYSCYVYENADHLLKSIEQYKHSGGNVDELKVLIKDVDHGHLLAASGLHHIDYLNEITAVNDNQAYEQQNDDEPRYFFGLTTGQNIPGVVVGSFGDDHTNATEVLIAYGLSHNRASEALQALRAGHYLLFVPNQNEHIDNEHNHKQGHQMHSALSVSFGETVSSSSYSSADEKVFQHASYVI